MMTDYTEKLARRAVPLCCLALPIIAKTVPAAVLVAADHELPVGRPADIIRAETGDYAAAREGGKRLIIAGFWRLRIGDDGYHVEAVWDEHSPTTPQSMNRGLVVGASQLGRFARGLGYPGWDPLIAALRRAGLIDVPLRWVSLVPDDGLFDTLCSRNGDNVRGAMATLVSRWPGRMSALDFLSIGKVDEARTALNLPPAHAERMVGAGRGHA